MYIHYVCNFSQSYGLLDTGSLEMISLFIATISVLNITCRNNMHINLLVIELYEITDSSIWNGVYQLLNTNSIYTKLP